MMRVIYNQQPLLCVKGLCKHTKVGNIIGKRKEKKLNGLIKSLQCNVLTESFQYNLVCVIAGC